MKFQEVSILSKWIAGLLGNEKKTMDRAAMELFITKTGTQMDNIKCELEKLVCYTMDRNAITCEDVNAVCTTQTTSKIFDMITAIATKNQKKALDLYYDLLVLKEPPMRIMYLITRQFNIMLQVKELINQRYDHANISKKLGIANFLVGKYVAQSKSFTLKQIKGALEECAATEQDFKSGRIDDKMGVELLIIKYSAK
jgi:DNA polymerase-3 subunit delta